MRPEDVHGPLPDLRSLLAPTPEPECREIVSAIDLLRAVAARVDEADPEARARLAGVASACPAPRTASPGADERTREAITALVDDPDRGPDIPTDALPPPLVTPPWRNKGPKASPTVVEVLASPFGTRVVGTAAEVLGDLARITKTA